MRAMLRRILRGRRSDDHPATVSDGAYPAILERVEEVRHGEVRSWRWVFSLTMPDGTTREWTEGTSRNFGVNTRQRAWAEALGVDAGLVEMDPDGGIRGLRSTDVDLRQFAGRRCEVVLVTRLDTDGNPVRMVDRVLPPPAAGKAP